MKKILPGLVLSLPLLLILIILSAYMLAASESGTRWLLNKIIDYSDQEIELHSVHGSLLSQLTVGHIRIQDCTLEMTIDDVLLQWTPKKLLQGDLFIEELEADTVNILTKSECVTDTQQAPVSLPEQIVLPVDIHLDHFSFQKISIMQNEQMRTIGPLTLRASVEDEMLSFNLQQLVYTDAQIQSEGVIRLYQPYSMQANLNWSYKPGEETWQGSAQLEGDLNRLQLQHRLAQPYKISTQLTVDNIIHSPYFDMKSQWQSVEYAIDDNSKVVLRDGSLLAKGPVQELHYELHSLVDMHNVKNIALSSHGVFDGQAITLAPLQVQHASTKIKTKGNISFSEALHVQLDLTGKDIDPSVWLSDYPGRISLDSSLNFTREQGGNQLQLKIHRLNGQLRGFELEGSGDIESDLEQIIFRQLQLAVGENQLLASGRIGSQLNMLVKVNAPNVEQLIAQAEGDVSGHLQLQGTRQQPQLVSQFESRTIRLGSEFFWQDVSLEASVKGITTPLIDVRANLTQLQVEHQVLEDITLQLQGNEKQHALTLSLYTKHGNAQLSASGHLDRSIQQWKGKINSLQLNNTLLGDWQNKKDIHLLASPQERQVSDLCLQQDLQQLCIDYSWSQSLQQALKIELQAFELAPLQSLVGEHVNISGVIHGNAGLQTDEQGEWQGHTQMQTEKFNLATVDSGDAVGELSFDVLRFDAELAETSHLQISFVSNRGRGEGQLLVDNLLTLDVATIRHGNLNAHLPELSFINPYVNNIVIQQGQGHIDLNFSGKLLDPGIVGQAKVNQLDFYLPELGTQYNNAYITLQADDMAQLDFIGEIPGQQAYLKLRGKIDLQNPQQPAYTVNITGKEFPVIDTLDYQANVSPELDINGDTTGLSITGNIDVPRLYIILKELPEGIDSVSTDEVIVTEQGKSSTGDAFVVTGEINVTLGNDAHFTGYGLQTDLSGGLKITLQEKQLARGHGVLSMRNGKYTALGQSLEISKGDIIFAGPLEDPSLDTQIKRVAGDVSVTMLVTGKASDPQTKLISDPALSEANKLSYLLTGRGISDLQSGEGTNLTSAALALGLNQSSSIIQEIGTKFGFDTVSVESGDNGLQSTSLLLGKHLSPRLYITYAKDLFSALGAIQLNYRLTDHISVEVESGARQTVDLIYSITTD